MIELPGPDTWLTDWAEWQSASVCVCMGVCVMFVQDPFDASQGRENNANAWQPGDCVAVCMGNRRLVEPACQIPTGGRVSGRENAVFPFFNAAASYRGNKAPFEFGPTPEWKGAPPPTHLTHTDND